MTQTLRKSGGVFHHSTPDLDVEVGFEHGWQAMPLGSHPEWYPGIITEIQYFSKVLDDDGRRVAVLMRNSRNVTSDLVLEFDKVPNLHCHSGSKNVGGDGTDSGGGCSVSDAWTNQNVGTYKERWTVAIEPHDSAMIVLSPSPSPSPSSRTSSDNNNQPSPSSTKDGTTSSSSSSLSSFVHKEMFRSVIGFIILCVIIGIVRIRRACRRWRQQREHIHLHEMYNRVSRTSSFGFDDDDVYRVDGDDDDGEYEDDTIMLELPQDTNGDSD